MKKTKSRVYAVHPTAENGWTKMTKKCAVFSIAIYLIVIYLTRMSYTLWSLQIEFFLTLKHNKKYCMMYN